MNTIRLVNISSLRPVSVADAPSFFAYCEVTVTDIAIFAVAVMNFAWQWTPKLKGMNLAIFLHFLLRRFVQDGCAGLVTIYELA